MLSARLPDNEIKRLEALRSYAVVDGPKEAAVDALVRVASCVCDVPIAVVTLVDSVRQCFLSSIGLDATETSREVAFCSHAILNPREILEVEDATLDERFCDNPLVIGEPRIRFYAGAPLVDAHGYALGTLCVIDRKPRLLTRAQRELLTELSSAVMKLIQARRTENAHHEAERQNALLRIAEEMAGLGHFRIDLLGDGLSQPSHALWSQQVLHVLGWSARTPMRVADFLAALHPSDRPRMEDAFQSALQRGQAFDLEARVLCGDRELRYVHVKARCDRDPLTGRVTALFGMLQDITERLQLRERALHQSRLLATGTLAAGVGHEINNPLTYVVGNIDLARERLRRGPLTAQSAADIGTMLQDASDGAARIRDIVRGLRTFARSEEALCATDVHSALHVALAMAMHELRHRASVHNQWQPVPPVMANEARLSQILVNLLVNAAQSFSERDPTKNDVWLRVRAQDSEHVLIEVSDNGPGIAHELQPRIFEPFFTTKPLSDGTGLGLSISHSLVSSLNGEISFESEPGRGTTFRVCLPVADPPQVRPTSEAPPRRSPLPDAPKARVLIIDDEPAIARSMQHVLSEEHEVTVCTDPRAALSLLAEEGESFDAIFCDLMMPFMSGMELYRRTVARTPQLAERFVFMTGAAVDEVVESFLRTVKNPPLEKPFSFEPLTKLVNKLLRAQRASGGAQ